MHLNLIDKKLCKNNTVYIFSYFMFIFMNIAGTIVLMDCFDYEPILYIVFTSSFIFISGLMSRCICVKCDQTNDNDEFSIIPIDLDIKKEYYSF
jgi:hypothetical protein